MRDVFAEAAEEPPGSRRAPAGALELAVVALPLPVAVAPVGTVVRMCVRRGPPAEEAFELPAAACTAAAA